MLVSFLHFYLFLYYLSVFDCGGSSWLHLGFVWLQQAGLLSSCDAQTYCSVLSCYGVWAYCGVLSCCGARALGRVGLSSCGFWALDTGSVVVLHGLSLPRGKWYLPESGTKPMSPALASEFFTLSHQRSLLMLNFKIWFKMCCQQLEHQLIITGTALA